MEEVEAGRQGGKMIEREERGRRRGGGGERGKKTCLSKARKHTILSHPNTIF